MTLEHIRNLSIIAHIDHGKSTLADRMLEICEAVSPREMRNQFLDSMELERERGITIKLQSVRLQHKGHIINLIDTPGHVDFGYEVSRSLAACEGVILLVDAAQGIEAQTLANCYHALDHNLEILAVLNKIDLQAADIDRCAQEIEQVLGIASDEILQVSGKTGQGVPELLDAILQRIPPPVGDPNAPLQALVFDSHFDQYRGVVSSIRVVNGQLQKGEQVRFMQSGATQEALEVGVRLPAVTPCDRLSAGASGEQLAIDSPSQMPPAGEVESIAEPRLAITIISPAEYAGVLMKLCQSRRGEFNKLEYLSPERVELNYKIPLGEVITDFFDQIKGRTQGYASLDYEPAGYSVSDLQKVDVLLQYEPVDAFSAIVHRDRAYDYGRRMCKKLAELIPRQQFEVPIQAAIGRRIIARETVKAYRKDVTAKLYGGDVTRKRKLLEKQKSGKKRMKTIGRVEVPQEAFVSALRLDSDS